MEASSPNPFTQMMDAFAASLATLAFGKAMARFQAGQMEGFRESGISEDRAAAMTIESSVALTQSIVELVRVIAENSEKLGAAAKLVMDSVGEQQRLTAMDEERRRMARAQHSR